MENKQPSLFNELVTLGLLPKIRYDIDDKSSGIGNHPKADLKAGNILWYFAYLNLPKQLYYVESDTRSQSETQEGKFGVISLAIKLGRNAASQLRSCSIYLSGNYVPKIS